MADTVSPDELRANSSEVRRERVRGRLSRTHPRARRASVSKDFIIRLCSETVRGLKHGIVWAAEIAARMVHLILIAAAGHSIDCRT